MLWVMSFYMSVFSVSGLSRTELAIIFAHPPTLSHSCRISCGRTLVLCLQDGGEDASSPFLACRKFSCWTTCGNVGGSFLICTCRICVCQTKQRVPHASRKKESLLHELSDLNVNI